MKGFLLRRLLQMIPTLAGVLLITFILFNAVGGSPAALSLGEQASPRALEEFDEVRGFNKPLLAGRWTQTRALPDFPSAAADAAGSGAGGAFPVCTAGELVRLPLRFPLRAGGRYRLTVRYRAPAEPMTFSPDVSAADGGRFQPLETGPARFSRGWKTAHVDFTSDGSDHAVPALRAGPGGAEVEAIRLRRRMRHLFDSQLLHYLGRIAHFDFGVSLRENQRVSSVLRQGIGPSLILTIPIFFGGLVLSLALSLVCAGAAGRWPDRAITLFAVGTMSVNYLVWIIAGQYVLAFRLGWFPVWGMESWRHLILPVTIGIASMLGANVRFYRTVLLEENRKEYVRTALSRGAGRFRILFRHVLPNALIPILTHVAVSLPFLYTGSLLLESFFGIPGLGYVGVNAIAASDADVLRAVVLIGSVLYMAANLLTDVLYAVVDPRVRLQ
jgi:peptide/nickel transport system permease protein